MPPTPQLVVGAAIIRRGVSGAAVLATQRTEPPELAGQWEFPGGKVERGEGAEEALVREVAEELGLHIRVDGRVGPEVSVAAGRFLLRVYAAEVLSGELTLVEHSDARWLGVDELDSVAWIEADAPIVAAVGELLASSR